MYRIALCEDSAHDKFHIQELIDRAFAELGEQCQLSHWSSAEGFFAASLPHSFDIAIFDVELDKMNGIEASRRLRANDKEVVIIFTSSHPEYVFSSFPSEPLNYLVKPVEYGVLFELMRESVRRINESRNTTFSFEAKGVLYNIPVKEIVSLESHARIVCVKTAKSDYEFYGKLDEASAHPNLAVFIRCHKSFLVNPLYIERIANDAIYLANGKSVPVSRGNMKRVKAEFVEFLNRENR